MCSTTARNKNFLFALKALVVIAVSCVLFSDVLPKSIASYASQRFLLVFFFGLVTTASIYFILSFPGNSSKHLTIFVLPSFLLSLSFVVVSLPYAAQSYVWVEPGMYGFFFLTPLCLGVFLSKSNVVADYISFLVYVAAAAIFLYGAMSINVYLFALSDDVANLSNFIPWGFVNIRYWSHIASWFMPLLPLATLVGPLKEHRLWSWMVAIGAGLWWWIIIMSSARGSALGIFFGFLLAALLIGRSAIPWVKLFVCYFFIGVLIWFMLSVFVPFLLSEVVQVRAIKANDSGRVPLFIEAWFMSLKNFPFGLGPQSWLTHEPIAEAYKARSKFGHPHNMYLMWAAEYGWLVIGLILVVAGQAARNFLKIRTEIRVNNNAPEAIVLAGITASVSGALFHAGVSAVFMVPGSMLVGLFVLSAFWGLLYRSETKSQSDGLKEEVNKKYYLLVIIILSLVWFAWARETMTYYQAMKADEKYYMESGGDGVMPRFWYHGNFPRFEEQE